MKSLYYVKTTLKRMLSNGVVTISYFIIFPILLTYFTAFSKNLTHENSLKTKVLNIQVIDEDNTKASKKLIELLESNDLKDIVDIVDRKPEVELIIKKGYEKDILSLSKGYIIINKKVEGSERSIKVLKLILNRYHEGLYVSIDYENMGGLAKIEDSAIIEDITIDRGKTFSLYEKISSSMIGYITVILILKLIQEGYTDININLDKRISATPITRLQYLLYETIALIGYVFIIITGYVTFFRLAGLSFRGNILDLLLLILIVTILVVSIVKSTLTIFSPKYGKIIGTIIFISQAITGEAFHDNLNKIGLLTPTYYLNNMFSLYNLNGNLEGCGKWIIIIIMSSIIIYSIAIIKTKINGERGICD